MQTATQLIFGALVGWLLSLYVRTGGGSYHALFALVGMAGSSIGAWLVDAAHVTLNRPAQISVTHRIGAALLGSAVVLGGFLATS